MANNYRHGGACCGVTHIAGFNRLSNDDKELIAKAVRDSRNRGHMYEVILTDSQIICQPAIAKLLKDSGFKLVSRFFNANSGNYCNVLHLHRNARGKSPWEKL